jgi:hypothetical protein
MLYFCGLKTKETARILPGVRSLFVLLNNEAKGL